MKKKKIVDVICLFAVLLFLFGFHLIMIIGSLQEDPTAPETFVFKILGQLEMLNGVLFLFSVLWLSCRSPAFQTDYPWLFLEKNKKRIRIFCRGVIIFSLICLLFYAVMMNLKGH